MGPDSLCFSFIIVFAIKQKKLVKLKKIKKLLELVKEKLYNDEFNNSCRRFKRRGPLPAKSKPQR